MSLRGEGLLCAALNLRGIVYLCGDKLNLPACNLRCEIYLSNMRAAAARNSVAAINLVGAYFLRRAQYVVKFKIYSAVNLMRFKVLTRRGICGIFGIYQIKF